MKIAVVGRGQWAVGWRSAGVAPDTTSTELGTDGGDATDADVLVIAVPAAAIAGALAKVTGIDGKPTIDATNAWGGRDESMPNAWVGRPSPFPRSHTR